MAEEPSLNINTETVCHIISCAQEFQAKEAVSFPEKMTDSENEYDPYQILADHEDDLTFTDALKTIAELEPDQQIELLALMYLGRGDFEFSEWEQAKQEAYINIEPRLTEYLFSKPQLPDYLKRGLEYFGFSCES